MKKLSLICAALCISACALALSGCKGNAAPPAPNTGGTNDIQTETASAATFSGGSASSGELSVDDAKQIALDYASADAATAVFTKEKKDIDDGKAVYELEFVFGEKKYDVDVSISDGSIVKYEEENISGGAAAQNGSEPAAYGNTSTGGEITEDDALEIALSHFGVKRDDIKQAKAEKDFDDGITEYEVEFYYNGEEYSCTVNAATGEIMGSEKEKADGIIFD